jgi:DNA-binding NtrC family response regulator
MQKPGVIVLYGDRQEGKKFCGLLLHLNYAATLVRSPEDLEGCLQQDPQAAVILDLDTVRPDNFFFRALKKKHPRLHILGISSLAFHPGLEEVIGSHLYACLMKPVDGDELAFWLKSIAENLEDRS